MLGSLVRSGAGSCSLVGVALISFAAGCSSSSKGSASAGLDAGVSGAASNVQGVGPGVDAAASPGDPGDSGTPGGDDDAKAPSSMATIPVPDGGIPAPQGQTTLSLPTAPALGTVEYLANRSSVRLYVPGVSGARDYRVFAVESGVSVSADSGNHEHVSGATIVCAGLRQRNQCCDDEILSVTYNNSLLDMPRCEMYPVNRRPNVPEALMQTLEVNGIAPNTTLVIEALDRQCPFPGLFGTTHIDVPIKNVDIGSPMVPVTVNNKSYTLQLLPATFPLRTESEIRQQYGSMIFNGQGPNQPTLDPTSPAFPESPYIRVGQPAPVADPVVLARSVVTVSPTGDASLPAGFTSSDLFDDFDDDTDQPVLLRTTDPANKILGVGTHINVYTTKNWVLYDIANQFSNFFIDRGQLNMVFGDPSQDSMTLQAMYPRARPLQLPTDATSYLHVTYEAQRNETPRRYENLSLCGADKVGQTYVGDTPAAAPMPRPGFMNQTGTKPTNVLGWNCLTLVGRGAGYGVVAGGDIVSHSDTSLKVTVVRSHPAPMPGQYDAMTLDQYTTAYGPTQESPFPFLWERQIDDSGKPSGVWLDDVTNIWQRARFDVFVRRDRVVMYVEGQQRLCQDLDPSAMTMAEVALGFWHILYHTSAEFTEIRAGAQTDDPQTDQHHVMHNTPFADMRTYDNVGVQENIALPAGFDSKRCLPATSASPYSGDQ
jgi:hypothetical protein